MRWACKEIHMKKLKVLPVLLIMLLGMSAISCGGTIKGTERFQEYSNLSQARPYLVVAGGNLVNEDPDRSVGLWYITSQEAAGFEEYAQTAIQAALDLYNLYQRDFTSVILIPQDDVRIVYAQVNFAADGKGAAGMTGSVPALKHFWKIWAAERRLNERELAGVELWPGQKTDFPPAKPLSRLRYKEAGLRQYIADKLQIPYDGVEMTEIKIRE